MDGLTRTFIDSLARKDIADTLADKEELADILSLPKRYEFPGAQPVSLEPRVGLSRIVSEDFLVCEKTDGTRYLFYIPRIIINAESVKAGNVITNYKCYLIDREYNFFTVFCHLSVDFLIKLSTTPNSNAALGDRLEFTGLFDGEVVEDTASPSSTPKDIEPQLKLSTASRELCFYLFDCMYFHNRSLMHADYRARLASAATLLSFVQACFNITTGTKQQLKFRTKRFYEKQDTASLFASLPSLPHKCDGIIFTSVDDPYTPGTCKSIQKWKPLNQNTVDCKVALHQSKFLEMAETDYTYIMANRKAYLAAAALPPDRRAPEQKELLTRIKGIADRVLQTRATVYTAELYVASMGLIEPEPVGSIILADGQKYETLKKKQADLDRAGKPLILEVFWDPSKEGVILLPCGKSLNFIADLDCGRIQPLTVRVRKTIQGCWKSNKVRVDKPLPNSRSTYESVCRSFDEHIDEERLCRILVGQEAPPVSYKRIVDCPFALRTVETEGYP